jgi:hypothetical protein
MIFFMASQWFFERASGSAAVAAQAPLSVQQRMMTRPGLPYIRDTSEKYVQRPWHGWKTFLKKYAALRITNER